MRGDIYQDAGGREPPSQSRRSVVRIPETRGQKTSTATLQPVLLTALLFLGLAVLTVVSVRCAAEDAIHREAPQGSNAAP